MTPALPAVRAPPSPGSPTPTTARGTDKTTYGGSNPGDVFYGYDDSNEMCWSGATSGTSSSCTVPTGDSRITYTANGDRMTYGSTSLRYDLAHRLTKATTSSGVDSYMYDALGNRAKATPTVGTATTYTWDPNAPVAQLASTSGGAGPENHLLRKSHSFTAP
jgi:YD repeat-containing protein